jgi:hypothetical protein
MELLTEDLIRKANSVNPPGSKITQSLSLLGLRLTLVLKFPLPVTAVLSNPKRPDFLVPEKD